MYGVLVGALAQGFRVALRNWRGFMHRLRAAVRAFFHPDGMAVGATSQAKKSFADCFVGTTEFKAAAGLIDRLKRAHTPVEQKMYYLATHLSAVEHASSDEGTDQKLEELRRQIRSSRSMPIGQARGQISTLLRSPKIAARLQELGISSEIDAVWMRLLEASKRLSELRNTIEHGQLEIRADNLQPQIRGGASVGEAVPVDQTVLSRSIEELNKLSREISQFSERLGQSLPFILQDQVFEGVAVIRPDDLRRNRRGV